ncbi:Signal transduction histidine kinase CheA [Labilithrix luteola]|uniref:histidine kinase n=1 Tax=Labilithrix luteola TaxID=1391654 RepID=A0A0K1QEZ0_9BACT|nr:ATP-binding protein [Labilithrix luteola]AKV04212.1 Signal transduction histidine kinase CheA [Labilithrix luteola]
MSAPSEAIVARFRSVALSRIDRLEAGWNALVAHGGNAALAAEITRELHTLKGDSRLVGFVDVNLLCHKLEDLLELAHERNYHVPDDVDLVVGMGLRFLATLVRKKPGTSMGGIDLHGFVAQIEGVLVDARQAALTSTATTTTAEPSTPPETRTPGEDIRYRVSAGACAVYLESIQAKGPAKDRLRAAWNILSHEIAAMGSVPLSAVFAHAAEGVTELAKSLGKSVRIESDVGRLRVRETTAEALGVALTHAVRNAIDHGIESPDDRIRAGKSATGTVRVRATLDSGRLIVIIEDDGAGIDFDAVYERAHQRGLVADRATTTEESLAAFLFEPGFSTAKAISDISGRGIGLDALKTALVRAGGTVTLRSQRGQGTTFQIAASEEERSMRVRLFRSAPCGLPFAVNMRWEVSPAPDTDGALDPFTALGLAVTPMTTTPTAHNVNRKPSAFVLRDGTHEVRLLAFDAPTEAVAERPCPTSTGYPVEIVDLAGTDVVLMRPDMLSVPWVSQ